MNHEDPTNVTLRQRGGGAAVHRTGAVLLATTSAAAEPSAEEFFERATFATSPPRLKRSRKSEAHDVSSVCSQPLECPTLMLTNSFTNAFDFGACTPSSSSAMMETELMPPPPPGPPPTDASFGPETATFGVSSLAPLHEIDSAPVDSAPPAAPAAATATADNECASSAPDDKKKARHNLTERKRITRMNELFAQLQAAVEEPEDASLRRLLGESATAASAPETTTEEEALASRSATATAKERSGASTCKAKVLEGALQCIHHLRQQLAEERLARQLLGDASLLSVTSLDDAMPAASCTGVAEGGDAGSAGDAGAAELIMPGATPQAWFDGTPEGDYQDVVW